MKNLKLLGVLLVSFMVMGLNVYAVETTYVNTIEELDECFETDNICAVKDVDFTEGSIVIPEGEVLTIAGKTIVGENAKLEANGNIHIKSGAVLDASNMNYGETEGLISGKPGRLIMENGATFKALDYWEQAWIYQGKDGWTPTEGAHLFHEDCSTGASVAIADRTYVLTDDGWKGAIAIGDKNYTTLDAAINDVPINASEPTIIKLLSDINSSKGIMTYEAYPKNIIFDLNGHTLRFNNGALVGSSSTVSQNIHIEEGSIIVFRNGTMYSSKDSRMFLQNYCDLTITDVAIDTTNVTTTNKYYSVSLNSGTIKINGSTSIKSKSVAFDAYWWPEFYEDGALVTVNTTGKIEGMIEVSASKEPDKSQTILKIDNINHDGDFVVTDEKLKDNVTINGGSFTKDINEYVKDGLYATKSGDIYVVGEPIVESEMEVLDPEKIEEVKEVTVGVVGNEKTDTIIAQSILKDDKLAEKTKDISVNVNVEIETIKEENASEEVKTAIKSIKEKAGKATVAHFFDVSILVTNTNTGESLGNVTNLTEEIELMILLPENLKNADAKLNRNYYVLREHDGKVDTIKAVLSKDGKYLVFKTDKFSTYALAYEDVAKVEEKVPQTSDGIITAIIVGTLATISAAGICLYLKKEMFN